MRSIYNIIKRPVEKGKVGPKPKFDSRQKTFGIETSHRMISKRLLRLARHKTTVTTL